MINLNNQFLTIIDKYKKIEESLNNMEIANSESLVKLNKEYEGVVFPNHSDEDNFLPSCLPFIFDI